MKLQLALDRLSQEECLNILEETEEYIDWIEVGTSIIKEYGMSFVKQVRALYPEKTLLVDMKTLDTGGHEAIQSFEAGADITTVMAMASNQTIMDTLKVANRYEKRVMVDLLEITDETRVIEIKELGVHLFGVHIGKDKQSHDKFDESHFKIVKNLNADISVAGGINYNSLTDVIENRPDIVVIGSAITQADNPKEAAKSMKSALKIPATRGKDNE